MQSLLCPACKAELVQGPEAISYELSDEHICNPNGIRPLRPVLVCPRSTCAASQKKVFWSPDGDGPYNTHFEDFDWIDTNPHPFNSGFRSMYFSIYYKEQDREFKTKWFMIRREVRYLSDEHGNMVKRRVRYSLWKRCGDMGYVYYIPGIRMLLFSLRRFYKMPKGMRTREALDLISQSKWPRAEWWRKAAAHWIKLFHKQLLRIELKSS